MSGNNKNSKKDFKLLLPVIIFGTFIIIGFMNFGIIGRSNTFRMGINIAGLIINFIMFSLSIYVFLKSADKSK